jgi:transposase InsO family protein
MRLQRTHIEQRFVYVEDNDSGHDFSSLSERRYATGVATQAKYAPKPANHAGCELGHHVQIRRIISDNGPQFIAKDFKEFIRISGMTHVRTSPYYPQSNGKLERWHKSLKAECIRPATPLTPADARRLIQQYVDHYNTVRLHSTIGFVTPADMLAGRQKQIHAARDHKLEQARRQRQLRRQQAA